MLMASGIFLFQETVGEYGMICSQIQPHSPLLAVYVSLFIIVLTGQHLHITAGIKTSNPNSIKIYFSLIFLSLLDNVQNAYHLHQELPIKHLFIMAHCPRQYFQHM